MVVGGGVGQLVGWSLVGGWVVGGVCGRGGVCVRACMCACGRRGAGGRELGLVPGASCLVPGGGDALARAHASVPDAMRPCIKLKKGAQVCTVLDETDWLEPLRLLPPGTSSRKSRRRATLSAYSNSRQKAVLLETS